MDSPWFISLHFDGVGNPVQLARMLQVVIRQIALPRTYDDKTDDADDTVSGISTSRIESMLGGTSRSSTARNT